MRPTSKSASEASGERQGPGAHRHERPASAPICALASRARRARMRSCARRPRAAARARRAARAGGST
jgi:hypothetical protein